LLQRPSRPQYYILDFLVHRVCSEESAGYSGETRRSLQQVVWTAK
jgi:hypothetical protein